MNFIELKSNPLAVIFVIIPLGIIVGVLCQKMTNPTFDIAPNEELMVLTKKHPCAAEAFRQRLAQRPEQALTISEATELAEQCEAVSRQLTVISETTNN